MVLGIRSKNRRSVSIQVHFVIHVQEIKPWPPSQSLGSAQSVLLQWENGDKNSGSFAASARDGKLEFNESFRLSALLWREASKKGTNRDFFQKNSLEIYLYESQNGKTTKSQLLGSATINLADYGIIKETTAINTPVNCKKSFRNTAQPFIYLNVQPFEIESSSSSPKCSLSKELSLDKEESESVSQTLNYDNDEDLEIASFTDNDDEHVSSINSKTVLFTSRTTGDSTGISTEGTKGFNREFILPFETTSASSLVKAEAESNKQLNGIKSPLSSMFVSSDVGNALNDTLSLPKSRDKSVKVADASYQIPESIHQSSWKNITRDAKDKIVSSVSYIPVDVRSNVQSISQSQMILEGSRRSQRFNKDGPEKVSDFSNTGKEEKKQKGKGKEENISMGNKLVEKVVKLSEDESGRKGKLKSASRTLSRKSCEQPASILKMDDEPEDVKSHKLALDTDENYGLFSRNQAQDQGEENSAPKDSHKGAGSHAGPGINGGFPNNKAKMKSGVELLQEELREAAALEVSLYSIVADHGSSANKVHAPARRLSRFYFHAYRVGSPATRASAALSVVSGFVLVSKACGNDVPRLTFWLSNLIVLRAILSKGVEKIEPAEVLRINSECDRSGSIEGVKRSHICNNEVKEYTSNYSCNWEDPKTILFALEKVEAWIFSRIVESVWWQTLTPHMQSAAAKGSSSRKIYGRRYSLGDQVQGNFSIDLWKRAFKDACERLCPLRACGHECGCLPVIARLVMEQLINRLDVAMFNAILRESDEEMPTDPISDPISDSKVLPILAGKAGFGAGAQLKNAIGNWSRWLSDLFAIDESDSTEDRNENDDNKSPECQTTPFKAFHLLNALSDLMMLPFEMLADRSIRKEVCPRFGVPLIKRVLYSFVPDEFCPGPIPDAVLEALDTEDLEDDEGSITSFPCTAASTLYSPPPAASVMGILQEVGGQILLRNGPSVLKKSYTSDDELDDLDSPLSVIGIDDLSLVRKSRDVVRYELLRQVWRDSE